MQVERVIITVLMVLFYSFLYIPKNEFQQIHRQKFKKFLSHARPCCSTCCMYLYQRRRFAVCMRLITSDHEVKSKVHSCYSVAGAYINIFVFIQRVHTSRYSYMFSITHCVIEYLISVISLRADRQVSRSRLGKPELDIIDYVSIMYLQRLIV